MPQTVLIKLRPFALISSVFIAVALLVASGLLAGKLTRRWGEPREFEQAQAMLQSFPEQIGPWRLRTSLELGQKARDILQCEDAYIDGEFVHSETGAVLRFTLIAGPYGPLSVHKPDVCYPYMGLPTVKRPKQRTVTTDDGLTGQFWDATFSSSDFGAQRRRVMYAWSNGGAWEAAKVPRFAFGGAPVLYRLQLDAGIGPDADREVDDNPAEDFLSHFLSFWHTQRSPPADPPAADRA